MSVPRPGVVFDLDGVLVASEHLWEDGWTAYAAAHGASWEPSDTRRCQGLSVPEWGIVLAEKTGTDAAAAAAAVVGRVTAAYDAGRVRFIDGAPGMVAAVAALAPVGLATSAPRRIIETVMDTMGMRPFFSASVSTEEVPRGKPSPDVYREAIARLGIDAGRSFAVEDSSNGIRAAAAAGLTVIGMAHDHYPIAPDAVALTVRVERSLGRVQADLVRWLSQPTSQVMSR
jgi:beta-phosphoglucomutase-like phosphatase (HAD superfamily)